MKIDNSINSVYKLKNKYYPQVSGNFSENNTENIPRTDVTFFESDMIDYEKMTKLALENLSQSYKNVNVYISNKNEDIKNLALRLGNGKHIIVSKDFLDKMSSDAESYIKGKKILEETFKQMSNSNFGTKSTGAYIDESKITFWNTYEKKEPLENEQNNILNPIKEMQTEMERLKEKFKAMKKNSSFNYPMNIYSKLAKARNIPEVRGVASSAKFKINVLRASLRDCDESEKGKIKANINQLEKAVVRAYRKVRALTEENTLSRKSSSGKNIKRKKLEEYNENELKRRRTIRRVRERAQIDEANPLYYYPQFLLKQKYKDFEESSIPTIDAAVMTEASALQIADVSVGLTVEISAVVEISI